MTSEYTKQQNEWKRSQAFQLLHREAPNGLMRHPADVKKMLGLTWVKMHEWGVYSHPKFLHTNHRLMMDTK